MAGERTNEQWERAKKKKHPEIENARGRSPWRFNLDELCSTTGIASLSYPCGEPAAFAAALSTGCAGLKPPTFVGCPTSDSTAGQPPGSDRCFLAWLDRWQAPDSHRVLRASDRLAANPPTCVGVLPPARPAMTPDSHLASSFSSAGLTASGSRRPPLQRSARATRCCSPQLALVAAPFRHTGSQEPTRIGYPSPALPVSTRPTFAVRAYLRLGLLMHPLLQLNLASPAEPSMSIPLPPVRAPSGSASF